MTGRLSVLVPALFAIACGATPKATDTLMESVRGYNDGLRWQRAPTAASMIPPAERELFLDERAEVSDDLRISGYDIKRVALGDDDLTARVRVRYTWYRDSEGTVHETTSRQAWERHGEHWLLVEEERVRGEPMPGVPEPREPDELTGDASPGRTPSTARSAGTPDR